MNDNVIFLSLSLRFYLFCLPHSNCSLSLSQLKFLVSLPIIPLIIPILLLQFITIGIKAIPIPAIMTAENQNSKALENKFEKIRELMKGLQSSMGKECKQVMKKFDDLRASNGRGRELISEMKISSDSKKIKGAYKVFDKRFTRGISNRNVLISGYNQDEDCLYVETFEYVQQKLLISGSNQTEDCLCETTYSLNSIYQDINDEDDVDLNFKEEESLQTQLQIQQNVGSVVPEIGGHDFLAGIEDPISLVNQVCAESIQDKVISVLKSDFSSPSLADNRTVLAFCTNAKACPVVDKVFNKNSQRESVQLKQVTGENMEHETKVNVKKFVPGITIHQNEIKGDGETIEGVFDPGGKMKSCSSCKKENEVKKLSSSIVNNVYSMNYPSAMDYSGLWVSYGSSQMRLQSTLLELVHRERTGEVINRGLMRNITKMLMDLGSFVYQEDFEKPFMEVSADFYRGESQQLIDYCDCGDYLKKAENRLNEEIERVSHYLDAKSEAKITNVVEKEMIGSHMQRLVQMENSGLVNMIVDDRFEDLGRMYSLFRRVQNGLSLVRDVMTFHIREAGKQLVTDPERLKDPVDFVQRLLDEKDKHNIISLAFNNDKTFQNALNSSFEYFINLNPRSPEFIYLFVDDKLRKGLKGVSEEDVEIVLDKVMMLFRYLQEKDVFEKYYKQHLAKRLLSSKTVSDEAERSLIVKLKTECGYQFTSKLEGMFSDMKTSHNKMQGFYSAMGADIADGPTLAVQVLTTRSWPIQSSNTCNLPPEISGVCDKFRTYYLGTHTGRRFSWQTNMGTAYLKVTFGKGQKHELNVSTYQMCLLMLLNNADCQSYKEIKIIII